MFQFLTYLLSPIFHLYYGLVVALHHPAQIIAHKIFGEKGRLVVIRSLNFFMTYSLWIIGARIKIIGRENKPDTSRPLVIVANHQSFYDISIIGHLFRKNNVKYVSKESLGKGIPTVSYNLRHGHSALVDRNNGAQAVRAILKLGLYIEKTKTAACIYPEGTRSKSGKVHKFQTAGINTLLRTSPSALVIPFAIKGHSDLIENSKIWLKIGQKIEYHILPTIEPKNIGIALLTQDIQNQITKIVEQKAK